MNLFEDIQNSYGFDPYDIKAVANYLREVRRVPLSLYGYRRAVRAILKRHRIAVPDTRLLDAVFQRPTIIPSHWPSRGMNWLNYWNSVAEWPQNVGSRSNHSPKSVAWAWSLGVPAHFACRAKCLEFFIPPAGVMSRRRLRAAYKLARVPFIYCNNNLRTADMVRLAKLPMWALNAIAASKIGHGDPLTIDWGEVAKLVNFAAQHRKTFEKAGFPASYWNPDYIDTARFLAAAVDAGIPYEIVVFAREHFWGVDTLKPIVKMGLGKYFSQGTWENISLVSTAIKQGWHPTNGKPFCTLAELLESADAFLATKEAERDSSRSFLLQAIYRRADRKAQQDKNWAIALHRAEYDRGKRIAPVMREVINCLMGLLEQHTIVIHGRDGELIYQLMLREIKKHPRKMRSSLRRRLVYVISSRPLLEKMTDEYCAYLRRRIRHACIHVDTGFAGSVPKRIMSALNVDGQILLVSASDPDNQIPIEESAIKASCPAGLRELVLSDLEHAQHRLNLPTTTSWGKLSYSPSAPGFWARFYGVIDAWE